jgi:predicted phage tail protein
MLRTVYLYGALGRRFGWRHRFNVATVGEAVAALSVNYPGFRDYFYRGPAYSIVKGATRREGTYLSVKELPIQLGEHDIHIIPAAYGQKGGGDTGKMVGKIIIGVVMMAAAFYLAPLAAGVEGSIAAGGDMIMAGAADAAVATGGMSMPALSVPLIGAMTYGNIAAVGGMIAVSGVAGLLSTTPQASSATYAAMERPEARASFLYMGPANTMEQGGPVPILYGEMRIGSTLISGSIETHNVYDVTNSAQSPGGTAEVDDGF